MNTPRTDAPRCKEQVHNNYSVTFHRCLFKAWKDGYCKKHHPDSVAERQKKSEDAYKKRLENSPYKQLERKLTAEREKVKQLREALEKILADAKQAYQDAGGCDHSVGICMCNESNNIEHAASVLEKTK